MNRLPPRSTRTDTPVPYPPPFRSPRQPPLAGQSLQSEAAGYKGDVSETQALGNGRGAADAAAPQMIANEPVRRLRRSEEHTSELQPLMRISYAVFCLKTQTPATESHDAHCVHTQSTNRGTLNQTGSEPK